jgi:TrmH family RNA methyltransferase
MKAITSRSNSAFKRMVRLVDSNRALRTAGMTIVEGTRSLSAMRDAGVVAECLVVAETVSADGDKGAWLDSIPARDRIVLSSALFNALSRVINSQGVMALAPIPSPEAWPAAPESLLLLEGIQNPGNLGSILRTAVAAGIRHVGLSAASASAWAPKVMRAAAGAHFHVCIHEGTDLAARIAGSAARVAATSPYAETSLYDASLVSPVIWLFGSEGDGLSAPLLDGAGMRLRVPMAGATESMNVAATVAVCLFEQVRQQEHARDNSRR